MVTRVDNPNFKRPFCTVSLLADEMCIFGRGIVWHPGLDESNSSGSGNSNSGSNSAVFPEESWYDMTNAPAMEECRVVCEKNSAIILDGESGTCTNTRYCQYERKTGGFR